MQLRAVRACWSMSNAAASSGAAGVVRDYWPEEAVAELSIPQEFSVGICGGTQLCLKEDEPAVAPLGLVSVVEENLHATLPLDTRHAIVGTGLIHEQSSRPYREQSSRLFRHLVYRGLTSSSAVHTTEPTVKHTVGVARHSKRWTREDVFILHGPLLWVSTRSKKNRRD